MLLLVIIADNKPTCDVYSEAIKMPHGPSPAEDVCHEIHPQRLKTNTFLTHSNAFISSVNAVCETVRSKEEKSGFCGI